MTPREQDQILHDLTQHLREKVLQDVADYIDTCRISGVSFKAMSADIIIFFSHFTAAFAANQFDIDAAEFGRTMAIQFRAAQKEEEAES